MYYDVIIWRQPPEIFIAGIIDLWQRGAAGMGSEYSHAVPSRSGHRQSASLSEMSIAGIIGPWQHGAASKSPDPFVG